VSCPTPEACEVDAEEPSFYGREHWREVLTDAALTACVAALVMLAAVVVVSRCAA
jgi:hypothetical protein